MIGPPDFYLLLIQAYQIKKDLSNKKRFITY
jgi:hypothetical protein